MKPEDRLQREEKRYRKECVELVWWGPACSGRWEQKGLCLAVRPLLVGHHRVEAVWQGREGLVPTGTVEGTLAAFAATWSCHCSLVLPALPLPELQEEPFWMELIWRESFNFLVVAGEF